MASFPSLNIQTDIVWTEWITTVGGGDQLLNSILTLVSVHCYCGIISKDYRCRYVIDKPMLRLTGSGWIRLGGYAANVKGK